MLNVDDSRLRFSAGDLMRDTGWSEAIGEDEGNSQFRRSA